ncbi:PTS galactitol transporter subunit IIC [Suicoccus acidiformans]|uniref:PTS galactitol transporter subunit IIC n=1 Tax=Suicoccus acidiformans TaxID=2036206 RepID=A0A347WIS2_9LACT|nr:PTS transporter subunit IIC [Suicoccus acidiformans]AXY24979.1 PTS galactitol transporter subunit IIC [Suicoccus acidiformans]
MNVILNIVQYIVDLGASVMLPIIIFILGMLFRQGVGKSLKSALTIGVGFIGIGLVVDLLNANLGPAAQSMAERFSLNLSVVDLGWPGTSPFAWASDMGLIAIPVSIVVNIIMLLTRTTKVVNVDIWNIWHMAFTGAIVQVATGSFLMGIVGVVIHSILAFKFGDIYQSVTDNYFGLEGVAIPHGTSSYMGVFAKPIDDLIEAIPGLNKINFNTDTLEERIGAFGDPTVIGGVLGFVIGLLAGYNIGDALLLAVQMAAVMVLMPVVVKFIMQGLLPISEAAKVFLDKRFQGGEFLVGMDPALLLGDPQVISTGLLFIPITILIAALVPGNEVLPFGDLATVSFFVAMAVAIHKGNIFRSLISGSIIMTITVWISNQMIGLQTTLGQQVNLVEEGVRVSSLDQAGSPITYLAANILNGNIPFGVIVIGIIYVVAYGYTYVAYKKKRLYIPDED